MPCKSAKTTSGMSDPLDPHIAMSAAGTLPASLNRVGAKVLSALVVTSALNDGTMGRPGGENSIIRFEARRRAGSRLMAGPRDRNLTQRAGWCPGTLPHRSSQ